MEKYMISPLDLTERQMIIYFCLYKKCNFENMQVSYTTQQIITDVKIIDLSVRIVNAEIKELIKKGHLKLVKKGTKGNSSVYEIVKNTEKTGNLSVTNTKLKSNLKDSNSNASNEDKVTNTKLKRNLNVNTIKDKEKEDINNIVLKLNTLASTNYKATTKSTISLVKARLKEGYTVEDFYKVIEFKAKEWLGTEFEKYLRPATLFGNKFEDYLNMSNKKAPAGTGADKNNSYTKSICNNNTSYTQKIEGSKFI